LRVEALVLEEAPQQREDDEGPRVADVDAAVDRRPTGVDPDLAGLARLEVAEVATERVLDANAGHGRDAIGARNNRSGRYPAEALTQATVSDHRLGAVEDAFRTLPQRYLGADPGFQASYRIELDDLGLSWAVELDEKSCTVGVSPKSDPDVVIGTDALTWLE